MKTKEILRSILEILKKVDEKEWIPVFTNFLNDIEIEDFQMLKRQILKIYGGMGSFNDLVLYDDGQLCYNENINLDKLRKELYYYLIDN